MEKHLLPFLGILALVAIVFFRLGKSQGSDKSQPAWFGYLFVTVCLGLIACGFYWSFSKYGEFIERVKRPACYFNAQQLSEMLYMSDNHRAGVAHENEMFKEQISETNLYGKMFKEVGYTCGKLPPNNTEQSMFIQEEEEEEPYYHSTLWFLLEYKGYWWVIYDKKNYDEVASSFSQHLFGRTKENFPHYKINDSCFITEKGFVEGATGYSFWVTDSKDRPDPSIPKK